MTDRVKPGLVTFYDIQPGNGAGLFLQLRNPHGALSCETEYFILGQSKAVMNVCFILTSLPNSVLNRLLLISQTAN